MAHFHRQAVSKTITEGRDLLKLANEAMEEVNLINNRISEATRLTYEAKYAQLQKGWDLGSACKKSRYSMRAAGLHMMRKQLSRTLRAAKKLLDKGTGAGELVLVRQAMYAEKMKEVRKELEAIRAFQALDWNTIADPKLRLESSHKQRAVTDSELEKFYKAGAKSSFLDAFLVAEFAGVRGEEFREGVRVEYAMIEGQRVLSFFIESAKSDGKKKGISVRQVDSAFPKNAGKSVQKRWIELAKRVADHKKSYVVTIEPTAKQTAGQRFTNAFKTFAKKADLDISAYSMRQRFSSQVKQANKGDAVAVALALGHQSTLTQKHYARASRGKGGISPMITTGKVHSGEVIRGPKTLAGPAQHIKESVVLSVAIPPRYSPPSPRPRGPRL